MNPLLKQIYYKSTDSRTTNIETRVPVGRYHGFEGGRGEKGRPKKKIEKNTIKREQSTPFIARGVQLRWRFN